VGKQWLNQIWVTTATGPRQSARGVWKNILLNFKKSCHAAAGYSIVSPTVQICMNIWAHFPI
jgi:hypothetical protein